MARRLASLLSAFLLAAALTPALARADGDPASDVLLAQNVFYPYVPAVPQSIQEKLNGVTDAAKRAGFGIKVALINSPVDLGAIPALFDKPQAYADFLDREISFVGKQPVLVVMPSGYGIQGVSPSARRALSSLAKPLGRGRYLADAALVAVPKLAAAAGHPLSASSPARAGGGASSRMLLLTILIAAAVLVAVLLLLLRSRDLLMALRADRRTRRTR